MSSNITKKIGSEIIKEYVAKLPESSGVYQMFNNKNQCLYVGKAKNLKKRVVSYTVPAKNSLRIQKMIAETTKLEHFITNTEEEALLLEADLIKNLAPRYNILLRDDKSFPYIEIDCNHPFPRIRKIKTKDISNPNLWGPFANSALVEETVAFVQKTFKLRVCSDHNFKNRSKPCIYYQIKRCSAPCVNKISQEDYKEQLNNTIALLKGNSTELKKQLAELMETAANQNNFEKAIMYREQIKMLSGLHTNYKVILPENINADFIAIIKQNNTYGIVVFIFRNGRSHGAISYFINNEEDNVAENILSDALIQFYKTHIPPPIIYTNIAPKDKGLLVNALKILYKRPLKINLPNKKLMPIMDFVVSNSKERLEKHLSTTAIWENNFKELANLLYIDSPLTRIETYDNSHFKGAGMLGVMVVAEKTGFNKKEYRIFKLKNQNTNKQDDYGMLEEALSRRLSKLKQEEPSSYPSLLIIDGGRNQLNVALKVLEKLKIKNINAISVVKVENRKFGAERILLPNNQELNLEGSSGVLRFILKLRDEAHRFAITSQRKANLKKSTSSALDQIPGIGVIRKTALLRYFGGVEAIKKASLKEIAKVSNLGILNAKKILEWLN